MTAVFSLAFPARAQVSPSLAISPEKFELSLSRGEIRDVEFRVANQSDVSLPIHLSTVRWDASDEVGGINFTSEPEDLSFDVAQWIVLGRNDFILEAGEAEKVEATIAVPKNAEPGGKYGAVFVTPTLPDFYFAKDAPRVLPQIGILFLIDIPVVGLEGQAIGPRPVFEEFAVGARSPVLSGIASRIASVFRAPLHAFAAEPPVSVDVLSGTASSFVLRVRNDGIAHIRPSGKIIIENALGIDVARADLAPTTILPGKIRRFDIALETADRPFLPGVIERQLALGRYRAIAVLEGVSLPGQENEPILASIAYWIFPWQGLLFALVLFVPLGFFGYRSRVRLRAALRALFRGRPLTPPTSTHIS